jgi:hypothetical protein
MATITLLILSAVGGLLALFVAAGWGSYSQKKLPDTPILFRWFVTGVLGSGFAAYAWLFGAGGDPSALLERVTEALEVKSVMEGLSSAVNAGADAVTESASELTVGMPSF